MDCELGVNYDETELALYLALEMETDIIPGVCEGTIIIEICCLCLCSCFYFDSKVLNSPVPPLYFVT